jgi:hypothetical protein
MPAKHPESHYLGGRLKPWWRKIQAAEDRRRAAEEREAEEQQHKAESER